MYFTASRVHTHTHTPPPPSLSLTCTDGGCAVLKVCIPRRAHSSYYSSVEATPISRGQGLCHQHGKNQQDAPQMHHGQHQIFNRYARSKQNSHIISNLHIPLLKHTISEESIVSLALKDISTIHQFLLVPFILFQPSQESFSNSLGAHYLLTKPVFVVSYHEKFSLAHTHNFG